MRSTVDHTRRPMFIDDRDGPYSSTIEIPETYLEPREHPAALYLLSSHEAPRGQILRSTGTLRGTRSTKAQRRSRSRTRSVAKVPSEKIATYGWNAYFFLGGGICGAILGAWGTTIAINW